MTNYRTHYVDTNEVAYLLDVSPRTVNRLAERGELSIAYKVEDGSAVTTHRYERTAVAKVARSRGREPKCWRCGLRESTHPVECCKGFLSAWEPDATATPAATPDAGGVR
jgi:hypothetical protein